ncbi:MAG: ribosome maturation factor RimP [Alphaproteobacteria bacterium]|jgi:ribosome maturation factor RimP|nr:ribosome maturation factor RimP [Alphaproteobacteria bacterium]
MSTLVQRLEELLAPPLKDLGFGIVRVHYVKIKRGRLQVMIERLDDAVISMEDCVSASREISVILDVADPIEESYTLEVTSPGLDRPLTRPEHFSRFQGEEVDIHTFAPRQGRRKFQGLLKASDATSCTLSIKEGDASVDHVFLYTEITKANLVPQY